MKRLTKRAFCKNVGCGEGCEIHKQLENQFKFKTLVFFKKETPFLLTKTALLEKNSHPPKCPKGDEPFLLMSSVSQVL